ncbi:hypothetical protein R5R35_005178 [Gryllus longicercus]|uniref:MPN domain-containing protein n=1 Tax=Gryllus longicercus TaxID=2509291 RepID=A0AAN9Z8B4_9ORTH
MQQLDEQDEKDEIDEEVDYEFNEEDYEEGGERKSRGGSGSTGRSLTLQMLLAAGILQSGEGTMAIEYLGQRFVGDLLPDGKIKSQETDLVFASPSAWAIHCKRIINPEKKSGCGWASVKYKGRKLDVYKTTWLRKRKRSQNKENEGTDDEDMDKESKTMTPAPIPRLMVKHSVLGCRSISHDQNTLVESTPFSSLGKIQPFLISMATNAVLVMDFHCHLTTSEVVGYLAGHWDVNAHNLAITHAFPCRARLGDREMAPVVEAEIFRAIEQRHLILVGWYHSHPHSAATPSLRDIDAQLEYEIRMKGNSDASYIPCVGVICSPYNPECPTLESSVVSYWVMPPPESKPLEYGKPMLMSYSVVQDQFLSQDALNEMKKCVEFYKNEPEYVKFSDKYKGNITYLEKLKTTLTSKFPRDQSDGILWGFIRDLVCPEAGGSDDHASLLAKTFTIDTPAPAVSSSPSALDRVNLLVPTIPLPSNMKTSNSNSIAGSISATLSSNLLMGSDIANALFATGKFPSPTSLMGLTSEASRSILGASNLTNMFMSPMGFKMDSVSILKPISTVNAAPLPSTSKSSPSLGSDITVQPVKVNQGDNLFPAPENLEKKCTVTGGQV